MDGYVDIDKYLYDIYDIANITMLIAELVAVIRESSL